MCGVAGSYRSEWGVDAALGRIEHRGPDGRGVAAEGDAVHGHVRLAILDLSDAASQPLRYRDGLLSFVGEAWNYRELRAELEALGHSFRSTGDTEVVAAALWQWGPSALARVDGMFSVAWSRGTDHFVARDRFGKVPLYARRRGRSFEWASERKAWGPEAATATAVEPGTCVDLPTGRVTRWYSLPASSPGVAPDVLDLLRAGVRKRLVSDAPLCVLASGGLDSTLILALAREVRPDLVAYAAVLDGESPDLAAAREVCAAWSVELREVRVPEPTVELAEEAVRAIEIPSKAQAEIAMLCLPLARRIAADGFKVCLSGEAADELFGGYGNMAIAASQPGASWREIREAQLSKMARGNFIRCNKAFMSAGVECRLPFMDRELVELVMSLSKAECPPGKGLLKRVASGLVPDAIARRVKQTFQGASGMSAACARAFASPTRLYNAAARGVGA